VHQARERVAEHRRRRPVTHTGGGMRGHAFRPHWCALTAVAVVCLLPACGGEPPDPSGISTQGTASGPSGGIAGTGQVFRRGCATLVFGGPAARQTPDDLRLGPVVFHGARSLANRRQETIFNVGPSGWRAFKTVTTVERGRAATVRVLRR
jgi:hypothetical protein